MPVSALLRPRADWVGVLEAAYRPVADDTAWAADVVAAIRPVFRCDDAIVMSIVEHDRDCRSGRSLANVVGGGARGDAMARLSDGFDLGQFGPAGFRTLFYPPSMVTTHSELEVLQSPELREQTREQRRAAGLVDTLGVLVHPEPGVVLVVSCMLDRCATPTRYERSLLSRVGLHLESAYRLRRRPEVVKGVLTLSTPPADPLLAHEVNRIELSISKKGRDRHEAALDLWTALVAGRYSLVSRTENGSRRYLVLENNPRSHAMHALSECELDVLSMAARGLSSKLVAYGLGLSAGAVSSALARAAAKLGIATRMELLRLAATLSRDPRAHASTTTLTAAETEVLALLREGLSNRDIARLRSRSVRTIANQVASLLRKTASGSRTLLATQTVSAALDEKK